MTWRGGEASDVGEGPQNLTTVSLGWAQAKRCYHNTGLDREGGGGPPPERVREAEQAETWRSRWEEGVGRGG